MSGTNFIQLSNSSCSVIFFNYGPSP